MSFRGAGRMVLETRLAALLKRQPVVYDIPALVDAYVQAYSFVDVDEVIKDDPEGLWDLVAQHVKKQG